MKLRWPTATITACWLALTGIAQAAPPAGDPITIGVIEDRSGAATFYSSESVKGIRLFVDMINRGEFLFAAGAVGTAPGIAGRPVRAIFEDD